MPFVNISFEELKKQDKENLQAFRSSFMISPASSVSKRGNWQIPALFVTYSITGAKLSHVYWSIEKEAIRSCQKDVKKLSKTNLKRYGAQHCSCVL